MSDQPRNVEDCLQDGEPDWDRIGFAVPCSRCGYELRMLTVPRCPECGLTFTWPDVLGASVRRSQFLFEYRWRDRPLRSWLETLWRGLRPWRFWREVSLHEHLRSGPLVFLILTAPLVFSIALHGGAALVGALAWLAEAAIERTSYSLGLPLDAIRDDFAMIALFPRDAGAEYVIIPGSVCLVLGGTLGLICALQQTLGRCRVRFVHVLRVMAYTVGPLCVLAAATGLGVTFLDASGLIDTYPTIEVVLPFLLLASPVVVPGVFLAFGLGRYLHLPRAWLIGPTAALVGWLFMMTVLALLHRL